MFTTKIVLKADTSELVKELDLLTRYSELFGDAVKESVAGFLAGLDSREQLFSVHFDETPTPGAVELLVTLKPSRRLLDFSAAVARDFNIDDVEQGFHAAPRN